MKMEVRNLRDGAWYILATNNVALPITTTTLTRTDTAQMNIYIYDRLFCQIIVYRDDNKRSMIEITSYYILYFYFKNLLPEGNFVRTFYLMEFTLSKSFEDIKIYSGEKSTRLTHIFFTIFFITTKNRRCCIRKYFASLSSSAIKFCWRHNHSNGSNPSDW